MLAIVIPFYKITFFEATLQSLALQTDKRFKVYIGDDASADACSGLLRKFEDQFDFGYHRFATNLGVTSLTQQWERCIAMTNNEEWLMILGDDDVLDKNVVDEFYKAKDQLDSEKINVLKFASLIIDESGKQISKVYLHPEKEKATDAYYKHYIGESRSSLSEYMFRRTSYDQFKFTDFPLAWHSDDKAWLDFTLCSSLYCCNKAVIEVRMSSENISGKEDNVSFKRKSRMLFLEDIIKNKLHFFTKEQKITFLFDFGVLLKELKMVTFKKVIIVFSEFCFMGDFYNAFRFLRRIYWIK